jgi:uncharacterized protein YhaN
MSFDGKAFGKEIVEIINSHLDRKLGEVEARSECLDAKTDRFIEQVNDRLAQMEKQLEKLEHEHSLSAKISDLGKQLEGKIQVRNGLTPVSPEDHGGG